MPCTKNTGIYLNSITNGEDGWKEGWHTTQQNWEGCNLKQWSKRNLTRSLEVCPQQRLTKKITKFLCHPEGKQAFP